MIAGLGRSAEEGIPTPVFLGFPCGSAGKESACNAGDLGSIPGLGKSPGEGKGYPLQYSGLENSIVHWVTKSQTQQTDFPFHFGGLELAPQEGQEKGTPGEAGAQHVQRCWGTLPGPPGTLT